MRPFDGEPDLLEGELGVFEGVDDGIDSLTNPLPNTGSLDGPFSFPRRPLTAIDFSRFDGPPSSNAFPDTSNTSISFFLLPTLRCP